MVELEKCPAPVGMARMEDKAPAASSAGNLLPRKRPRSTASQACVAVPWVAGPNSNGGCPARAKLSIFKRPPGGDYMKDEA